jgi:hypothetical protein
MCDGDGPPKFAKGKKEMIREMVEASRNAHMDTGFWDGVDTRAQCRRLRMIFRIWNDG